MRRFAFYPYLELIRGSALLRSGGWRALLDALPPAPAGRRAGSQVTQAVVRRCARAARLVPLRTQCLERSYGACATLRRYGIPAQLCIGVSRRPPMRFHAWVEVDGQVVNDSPALHDEFQLIRAF